MAEESKAPIVRTMTKAHFRALCDAEFRSYMVDEENPIVRLSKRIAELQKEIDTTKKEAEVYEKTISLIVKHHEMFLHRTGIRPKENTRSVGVNVNMSSPPEPPPSQRSTLHNQIAVTPTLTTVKSEPGIARPETGSSVDNVDLTDEDKSQMKLGLAKNASCGKRKAVQDKTVVKAPNVETSLTAQRTYSRSTDNISTLNVVPTVAGLPPVMQFAQLPPGIIRSVSHPNILPQVAYVLNRGHPQPQPVQMVSHLGPPGTVLLPYPGRMIQPLFRAVTTPRHPAPLPAMPKYLDKPFDHPTKPTLSLTKRAEGIFLSWDMHPNPTIRNPIKDYEIYIYEEPSGPTGTIDASMWKKVGEVAAMPLPMACTLTQCAPGRRYHFAIRACDSQNRVGPFSNVTGILLPPGSK